ncbi:Holliday junction resolvase RuvX [Salinisphaera sp. SPP-AMP-43]|uniref:Holliday junction resolvase RuvX n=1 Tax=Salinisphaera sp. SPP-AMP-43 TaxID=3121288 RepID=UPI003C6E692D
MPDAAVVLGFDYGKRRVGIAVGSSITATAQPLIALEHHDGVPDWDALDKLVAEWRPGTLIVGLPLNADGATQKMTNRARNFAQELWGRYRLSTHTVDERYSTIEAGERLKEARASGSRGRRLAKGDVDAMAAQTILESWLLGHLNSAEKDTT